MYGTLSSLTSFALLGTAFLHTVNALTIAETPVTLVKGGGVDVWSKDPAVPDVEFFFKGLHHDNVTGQDFHLWTLTDDLTEAEAFAQYWEYQMIQDTNTTALDKRGWYDCQELGPFQSIGCGAVYGLGNAIRILGGTTLLYYFKKLIDQAFDGTRDNQSPRSECMSGNGYVFCVSWKNYTTVIFTQGDTNDLAQFAVNTCAANNWSAEGEADLSNGQTLYVCNSSRAKDCGCCVC